MSTLSPPPPLLDSSTYLQQGTAITLDNMKEHFCYYNKYSVLVCKEHATSIQNVDVHLRKQHAATASAERNAVVAYCN
jgi:hypothetical protein